MLRAIRNICSNTEDWARQALCYAMLTLKSRVSRFPDAHFIEVDHKN